MCTMPTIHRERALAFVAGLLLCTVMSGSMSLISKHNGMSDGMDAVSRARDKNPLNTRISGSLRVSQTVESNATSVRGNTTDTAAQNSTEDATTTNKNGTVELPVSEAIMIGPVENNGIAVAILTMASAVACALSIVAAIALFRNRDNASETSDEFLGNELYSIEESSGTSAVSSDDSCEDEVVYEKKRSNRRQKTKDVTQFAGRIVRDELDDITPEEAV